MQCEGEAGIEQRDEATADVAVAFDQTGELRDLRRQRLVPGQRSGDTGQPAVDALVLDASLPRDRSKRAQPAEQPDAEIAAHRRRPYVLPQRRPPMRPATLRPSREWRDEPVRQDPPDLVEVR